MSERPGIMLYFSEWLPMLSLDDSSLGRMARAAMQYGSTGEAPSFETNMAILWGIIASKIDRDGEAYSEKCRKARHNRYVGKMRRENKEPLEYEEWIERIDNLRPSTSVDERDQLQPQPQSQSHLQSHIQQLYQPQSHLQGQGDSKGNEKENLSQLSEAEFERRKQEAIEMVETYNKNSASIVR